LEDELRFVTITSTARVETCMAEDLPDFGKSSPMLGLRVAAVTSTQPKCVRCWHSRADVGALAEHPQLCGRCVDNITGKGEQRKFA
jgi:isoleucyl-tRNA synthetase